jgi:putative tricarboxylic transport membrane protein
MRGMDGRPAAPARPYWLGHAIIAIGCVWLYGAASLPQTAQYAQIGPGLFVTVIGVVLIALGGILLAQIARGERFAPQEAEDAMADAPADKPAFFTALAAAALPILTMRALGFPITATLSFLLVARAFGSRRLVLDIAVGAVLAAISYWGFTRLGVGLGPVFPFLDGR